MADRKRARDLALCVAVAAFAGVGTRALADSATSGVTLRDTIPALIAQYARQGDFNFPEIGDKQVGELVKGAVVVIPFAAAGHENGHDIDAMRAVGLVVVDAPRLLVWLAMLHGSDGQHGRMTRATLSRGRAGSLVRYQHMNLPWPFEARQWVIACDKNVELAAATGGRIWEHRWSLEAGGQGALETAYERGSIPELPRTELEKAIYLPANRGAWILFDLGGAQTLVAAYLDVDFGGYVPAPLVRMFAKRQLRASLKALRASSHREYLDYDEMPVLYDGYGAPISKHEALAAAATTAPPSLLKASNRATDD